MKSMVVLSPPPISQRKIFLHWSQPSLVYHWTRESVSSGRRSDRYWTVPPSTIHPSHRPVRSATPDVLLTTIEIQFEERGKYLDMVLGSKSEKCLSALSLPHSPVVCPPVALFHRPFCHPLIFILRNVSHSVFPVIPVSSFQCFCFVPCCNVSSCQSVYILWHDQYCLTDPHSEFVLVYLYLCICVFVYFFVPDCLLWHDRCCLTDPLDLFCILLSHTNITHAEVFPYSTQNGVVAPAETQKAAFIEEIEKSSKWEFVSAKPAMFSSFPETWVGLLCSWASIQTKTHRRRHSNLSYHKYKFEGHVHMFIYTNTNTILMVASIQSKTQHSDLLHYCKILRN